VVERRVRTETATNTATREFWSMSSLAVPFDAEIVRVVLLYEWFLSPAS
jgi:hypothetical protein